MEKMCFLTCNVLHHCPRCSDILPSSQYILTRIYFWERYFGTSWRVGIWWYYRAGKLSSEWRLAPSLECKAGVQPPPRPQWTACWRWPAGPACPPCRLSHRSYNSHKVPWHGSSLPGMPTISLSLTEYLSSLYFLTQMSMFPFWFKPTFILFWADVTEFWL